MAENETASGLHPTRQPANMSDTDRYFHEKIRIYKIFFYGQVALPFSYIYIYMTMDTICSLGDLWLPDNSSLTHIHQSSIAIRTDESVSALSFPPKNKCAPGA